MNNYIKEVKAILIFLVLIIVFFSFIYVLSLGKVEYYFYVSLVGYLILATIAAITNSIFKNKLLDKIVGIILFPSGILWILLTLMIPFGTLFLHLIFYGIIAVIVPIILIKLLEHYHLISFLKESTILYLQITISVFISVLFNHQIRKIIYMISPARIYSSKKLKPFELEKLTDYVISEKNIRFIIYSMYVIVLMTINIYNFQEVTFNLNQILDKAILESFITFIAFDQLLILLKQLDFKPSDLLIKIMKSISNKFKEDIDQNNS